MTAIWLSLAAIVLTVPIRRRRRVRSADGAGGWLRLGATVGLGSLVFGVASGAVGLVLIYLGRKPAPKIGFSGRP